MTPKDCKRTRVLLIIAGILALLLAIKQTAFYVFASANLKEILRNGSAKLFGIFPVTESAAFANPSLTTAILSVLISAACLFSAHWVRKKYRA